MTRSLEVIGAPSSAAAYSPGQERAPEAIRAAGLLRGLRDRGITVNDRGDVPGFRWSVDRANPRAMNAEVAAGVARAVADLVADSLRAGAAVLVLGGDCTIELGTVAGAIVDTASVGLIYVDLDTDLNTPLSVDDGALDWMGVAHLLNLDDTVPVLAGVGTQTPMLRPAQIAFFATDNVTPFERRVIEERGIKEVRLAEVDADPAAAARGLLAGWGSGFERLLVHVDVDVLDYLDLPLAEEHRRNRGLRFTQLVAALREFVAAPNWVALTISEVNPDHGEADGSTLRTLSNGLTDVLAGAAGIRA
jgi:arginase